MARAIVIEAQH